MLNYFHPLNKLHRLQQGIEIQSSWGKGLIQLIQTPLPQLNTLINDYDFIALDIETTGLDAEQDKILSLGTVALKNQMIDIGSSSHIYIDEQQAINPESAVINHIVPEMLETGLTLSKAMDNLFAQLAGKAVIVHGAVMEKSFLDAYTKANFGINQLPILWIDTLVIEKHMTYQHAELNSFQLNDVRHRHQLPEYPAHNALIDAIACSELFLAQLTSIFGEQKERLTFKSLFNSKVAP